MNITFFKYLIMCDKVDICEKKMFQNLYFRIIEILINLIRYIWSKLISCIFILIYYVIFFFIIIMDRIYKISLFLITILLEIAIGYAFKLEGDTWNTWDKGFCIFVFCCHIPFYFALFFENRKMLDILHFTVFLSTLFGLFVNSYFLLLLIISFCIGIQMQWTCINKCILNSDDQNIRSNFGFGKITTILTLLYTCFLSYRLGIMIKRDNKKYVH